jgi:hypothetical protein
MQKRLLPAFLFACLVAFAGLLDAQDSGLKIVVIAGEGAVNIIQQKTAVAPIIEVRDRNNVPVSGATVTFSVSGKGATFGSGSTLTVTTNGAGQATATGLTPTATGAVQVNVSAALKGLIASATITQTNFATAAAAAAAASGGSAAAGAAGAGGGGGISAMTIGLIGAAAAGGVGAAYATGAIGGGSEGNITFYGQVFATAVFGAPASACTGFHQVIGTGSTCYLNPLSGATVSTSLDGNTATTDGAGNFDLVTTLPLSMIEECRTYTITITASGHPTYSVNSRGFAGNQQGSNRDRTHFALSPPTPSMMSGC